MKALFPFLFCRPNNDSAHFLKETLVTDFDLTRKIGLFLLFEIAIKNASRKVSDLKLRVKERKRER
jgi:hypothetical protein